MANVLDRWRAFDDRPFPKDVAGEINGINLKSIEQHVAFLALSGEKSGFADVVWQNINLVLGCRHQLAVAQPALAGDARDYFAELDGILAQMLDEAANSAYQFANITGVELSRRLTEQIAVRLPSSTPSEQFHAALGAALVAVANVLQGPIKGSPDPKETAERMVQLSADWLRQLVVPG